MNTSNSPAKEKFTFWSIAIVSAIILAIGIYRAVDLKWVTDDAFVTFRYVKHFVAGLGPVYNAGEHVEGYTNFLWFVILSIGTWLGAETVNLSIWLSILCFGMLLLIYLIIAKRESDINGNQRYFLPLTAILLALNYDMDVWATSGLETCFYTLLISATLYAWFYSRLTGQRRLIITGILLMLLPLTRPDGILFIMTAVGLLLGKNIREKKAPKVIFNQIALLLLPSVVVGIPYLLWKLSFFGDILPNTYYVKSGGGSYIHHGVLYFLGFFKIYWSAAAGFILLPLILAIYERYFHPKASPKNGRYIINPSALAALIAAVVYLGLFVFRTADYMVGRFMIPVLPLLYFVIERSINQIPRSDGWLRYVLAACLVLSLIDENSDRIDLSQTRAYWQEYDQVDQRQEYSVKQYHPGGHSSKMELMTATGNYLRPFFAGMQATIVHYGICMLAYYGDFEKAIEAFGLTDSYIAHLPIDPSNMGKIGAEKMAPYSYLRKRNVSFAFENDFWIGKAPPSANEWNLAWFYIPDADITIRTSIVMSDTALFSELNRRFSASHAAFFIPDLPRMIPDYISNTMRHTELLKVHRDYDTLKAMYFSKYPNPVWQSQIEAYIDSGDKSHNRVN